MASAATLLVVLAGLTTVDAFTTSGLTRRSFSSMRTGASLVATQSQATPAASPTHKSFDASDGLRYLATACATSCVLRGASDLASQAWALGGMDGVSFAHGAAMATMGLTLSGLCGASWLRLLENMCGDGKTPADAARKAAADFVCWAPLANSAYLLGVPFLTALYSTHLCGAVCEVSLTQSLDTLRTGFGSAMQLEASIFVPYNLISFKLIPPTLRPQTTAVMCAFFTMGLSHIC